MFVKYFETYFNLKGNDKTSLVAYEKIKLGDVKLRKILDSRGLNGFKMAN